VEHETDVDDLNESFDSLHTEDIANLQRSSQLVRRDRRTSLQPSSLAYQQKFVEVRFAWVTAAFVLFCCCYASFAMINSHTYIILFRQGSQAGS
jgi:hypothetical protein